MAAATRTLFVVDTLEHLRRGGRIGAAAAFLGSALAVKPVLHVLDGRVVPLEKVRTSARALNRLVQRAVEAAGDGPVSVAVHHLAAPERPTGWPPSCASGCPPCGNCTSASSAPRSGRTSAPARSASWWPRSGSSRMRTRPEAAGDPTD